jgi:predicted amidohydrolase YtcJ
MNKISLTLKSSSFRQIFSEIRHRLQTSRLEFKVHDYSKRTEGIDYLIELAQKETGWYLSSQGKVKEGDRVILFQDGKLKQYKVALLERYSDRPSMFMSLLKEDK